MLSSESAIMKNTLIISLIVLLCSCATRRAPVPAKYSAAAMQSDFDMFRAILEESHPGLYWYTPRDSMNYYFDESRKMIRDSMSAPEFRLLLNYTIAKIRCGHTAARLPKHYPVARDTTSQVFPLQLKIWPDTAIITQNISRRDSAVRRGAILHSIDGRQMSEIRDTLFQYLSTDGYNLTHKYQTLSNRNVFGSLYTTLFGNKAQYAISYTDSLGMMQSGVINSYVQPSDSGRRTTPARPLSKRERKKLQERSMRAFTIDTTVNAGVMELNTFTKNAKLRKFFRQSFRTMQRENLTSLIVDLRSNGGGTVTYSNLLTKYLSDRPFKIADSLYAVTRYSKYGKYQQTSFLNRLFLMLMTKKMQDGNYHFRYYENRRFQPKRKNHFDGDVYLLSGGNTYSAATLVMQSLKPQENVIIVGEETGGGQYGNNAWLIPDMTLPNTKMRFRLPLFRLVIDKEASKGFGVFPEVEILPTVEAIRNNRDFKMDAAKELIRKKRLGL
jgi:hypothetical protein